MNLVQILSALENAKTDVYMFLHSDEYNTMLQRLADGSGLPKDKANKFYLIATGIALGVVPVANEEDAKNLFRSELFLVGDQLDLLARNYWEQVYEKVRTMQLSAA